MGDEERDVRLPQRWAHKITILAENGGDAALRSSMGRWLAQHLDPASGVRYSAALLADGRFAAIAKSEGCEAVTLRVFADIGVFAESGLPAELIEAARRTLQIGS